MFALVFGVTGDQTAAGICTPSKDVEQLVLPLSTGLSKRGRSVGNVHHGLTGWDATEARVLG